MGGTKGYDPVASTALSYLISYLFQCEWWGLCRDSQRTRISKRESVHVVGERIYEWPRRKKGVQSGFSFLLMHCLPVLDPKYSTCFYTRSRTQLPQDYNRYLGGRLQTLMCGKVSCKDATCTPAEDSPHPKTPNLFERYPCCAGNPNLQAQRTILNTGKSPCQTLR